MGDDDLSEILAALDDERADGPPPYTERLWVDVRRTLERTGSGDSGETGRSDVAGTGNDVHVVEVEVSTPTRSRRRPGRVAVTTGAIAAAAALVVGIAVQSNSVRTDPTPPAATPVPTVPTPEVTPSTSAEACLAYSGSGASLSDLLAAIEDGTADQAAIDAAVAALSELETALAATGDFTDAELDDLPRAARTLEQAALELEAGDVAAAARSVGAAAGAVSLDLPAAPGEVVRRPCLPDQ